MEFHQVVSELYCCPIFGEDYSYIDPDKKKFTLAMFGFFGTLVWGESGMLYDYNSIILSSPFCKENFVILKDKGYTICVLEYIPKKKLNKFLATIQTFYYTVQNKVSIHFFAYTNKELSKSEYLKNGILNYFKPESGNFEKNSFYCGFRLQKFHSYPWFRYKGEDLLISDLFDMKSYDPFETLGIYQDLVYKSQNLYITCGQEFSGYEIELESFRLKKFRNGLPLKYKCENGINIYAITVEELKNISNKIKIESNESFIVIGSNPTFEERLEIKNKFFDYLEIIIVWYGKYPYKKGDKFREYIKKFQNPLISGETFVRAS
jgi:hypothetical protein